MINSLTYSGSRMMGAIMTLSAAGFFPGNFIKQISGRQASMPASGELLALSKAGAWLNSKPITAADLEGKVVLVEFGTYTCINWLRTLPYIRAWDQKYKDKGLEVIIVHTPEFSFERNIDNVERAISQRKINFPIAIDNNYNIWKGFNNQYWPAIYLIDTKGRIRHQQFGEGGYGQTETIIQQLLAEAGAKGMRSDTAPLNGNGVEAAADWANLDSRENYLGFERTERFSSPGGQVHSKDYDYTLPKNLSLNQWALWGNWTAGKQSIISNTSNGKLVYRFHARDLHLVMGAASAGSRIRFRVLLDGKPPEAAHGTDIDEQGNGTVTEQRLYQLLRQPAPIIDRQMTIEFIDPGAEAFAFTFG